jgi:hypothetical protein
MIGSARKAGGVLVAVALVAMAAVSGSAQAATATQTQSLQAELNTQVAWGSAGGCTQNIQTNDFGALTPNAVSATLSPFDALSHALASTDGHGNSVWVGCVTANTTLASVTAQGTADMKDTAGDTLPMADVAIGTTNSPAGGSCGVTAGQSSAGSCTLPSGGTSQSLLVDGAPGTSELDWQYQVNLPANQPSGSYSGGQVTFTATA